MVVWCSVSEADLLKHPASSDDSTTSVPVIQYSAEPQMYSVPPGTSTESTVPHLMQSAAGFVPDASQPYVQQIVQQVVEAAGPPTAVFQPAASADALTYRQLPQSSSTYQTAAQSTLVLQQETNAAPTHFVVPTPAPPPMNPAAFGPSLPQFVVGQPGAVRPIEVERFSAPPPPPPPPGSVPYPAMPCVSGINTASGAVSYWMTLN